MDPAKSTKQDALFHAFGSRGAHQVCGMAGPVDVEHEKLVFLPDDAYFFTHLGKACCELIGIDNEGSFD